MILCVKQVVVYNSKGEIWWVYTASSSSMVNEQWIVHELFRSEQVWVHYF